VTQSSYPSGEFFGPSTEEHLMALLALSHTPLEDQLYRAMLGDAVAAGRASLTFSIRRLSALAGISSTSSVRRALNGLLCKLSIESMKLANNGRERQGYAYQVFKPGEIFERRRAAGLEAYPKGIAFWGKHTGFTRAIERVAVNSNLSRREAQIALACAEGMTNAEIGEKFKVSPQTVKFHLRNIFTKFGVRRRTELISRLLVQDVGRAAVE